MESIIINISEISWSRTLILASQRVQQKGSQKRSFFGNLLVLTHTNVATDKYINPMYIDVNRRYQGFDPQPYTVIGVSASFFFLNDRYPLVIQHSHGKWPVYRWFTY